MGLTSLIPKMRRKSMSIIALPMPIKIYLMATTFDIYNTIVVANSTEKMMITFYYLKVRITIFNLRSHWQFQVIYDRYNPQLRESFELVPHQYRKLFYIENLASLFKLDLVTLFLHFWRFKHNFYMIGNLP